MHRNHGDGLVDHGVDRAGDQIVDRGTGAPVRDVVGLRACHMQEGDGSEMGGGARARMPEIESPRLRLQRRDQDWSPAGALHNAFAGLNRDRPLHKIHHDQGNHRRCNDDVSQQVEMPERTVGILRDERSG